MFKRRAAVPGREIEPETPIEVLTAPRRQSLRRAARGGERYHPVPHSTHGSRARRADHERVAGKGWDWRRHGDGRVREAATDPKSKGLPALGVRAACLAARGRSRGHVDWGFPARTATRAAGRTCELIRAIDPARRGDARTRDHLVSLLSWCLPSGSTSARLRAAGAEHSYRTATKPCSRAPSRRLSTCWLSGCRGWGEARRVAPARGPACPQERLCAFVGARACNRCMQA